MTDITRNISNVFDKCTGCSACKAICPVHAIHMYENKEGFLEPVVDATCIKCGKCRRICPAINDVNREIPKFDKTIYAAYNINKYENRNSSSGGIFILLARNVIEKENGVVFGTVINENNEVVFSRAETIEGVKKMIGSKYVYSKVDGIYMDVECELKKNKRVLFSGVSCQIAALYSFLGKEYQNLLTVEILCHGAPAPGLYRKYINFMEKRYKSRILNVNQRDYTQKWTPLIEKRVRISFTNGKSRLRKEDFDPYMSLFIRELCYRKVCYQCKYVGMKRNGDIVLGDFGGLGTKDRLCKKNKLGFSFMMVNSEIGEQYIAELDDLVVYYRTTGEIIIFNSCLSRTAKMPERRERFMNDYKNESTDELFNKYYYKDFQYRCRAIIKNIVIKLIGSTNIAKLMVHLKKG